MVELQELESKCFNGIYKEFTELFGVEMMLQVYENFRGMTLSFPKKLLDDTYLHTCICQEYDETNAKQLARKYDYTLNWIMQIIKRNDQNNISKI